MITVADMVRTERAFLDELGIERLAAVAGGSLGGMQAFEWAVLYPGQVDAVVAIASTHALQPQGVAWNSIARDAIMRDPAWQGGRYYGTGRAPDGRHGRGADGRPRHVPVRAGAERQVRPCGCSSPTTSATRSPSRNSRSRATCATRRTRSSGASTPTPISTLSRALTYFDLARQHGGGSLARALDGVSARTLLIAFSSDWLYPPSASREIADALGALGKPAEFHVIEAPYGHDCFLLEEARQTPIIRQFLGKHSPAEGRACR